MTVNEEKNQIKFDGIIEFLMEIHQSLSLKMLSSQMTYLLGSKCSTGFT